MIRNLSYHLAIIHSWNCQRFQVCVSANSNRICSIRQLRILIIFRFSRLSIDRSTAAYFCSATRNISSTAAYFCSATRNITRSTAAYFCFATRNIRSTAAYFCSATRNIRSTAAYFCFATRNISSTAAYFCFATRNITRCLRRHII